MSHELIIHLSDTDFAQLESVANSQSRTPTDLAGDAVLQLIRTSNSKPKRRELTAEELAAALKDFEKHIGAANLGYATGVDNESIDADLAREYADTHDDT